MDYYVEYFTNEVTFPKEKAKEVLTAINALHEPKLMKSQSTAGTYANGQRIYVCYSWTENPPPGGFTSLEDAFGAWRFDLYQPNDEVYSFNWIGEKLGDEEFFFNALAPYAKGKIYARGEDGEEWGYKYKNGTVGRLKCVVRLKCIKKWVEQ